MLLLFYVLDLLSNVTLPSIIIIVYNTIFFRLFKYSNVTSYMQSYCYTEIVQSSSLTVFVIKLYIHLC